MLLIFLQYLRIYNWEELKMIFLQYVYLLGITTDEKSFFRLG